MMIILNGNQPPLAAIEYGRGVFETIAMITWGEPIALSQHVNRLNCALKYFGADGTLQVDHVMQAIHCETEKLPQAQVKIIAYLAGKDVYCQFVIKPYPYVHKDLKKGFKIGVSQAVQISTNPLNYHKTLNYWERLELLKSAENQGLDEIIRLNERGDVCEGTKTNVFVYHMDVWYTPPIESGILNGVTRQLFLDWLLKNGEKVKVTSFDATFLKEADTIAVTNSLIGIVQAYFHGAGPRDTNKTINAFRMHYLGGYDGCKRES